MLLIDLMRSEAAHRHPADHPIPWAGLTCVSQTRRRALSLNGLHYISHLLASACLLTGFIKVSSLVVLRAPDILMIHSVRLFTVSLLILWPGHLIQPFLQQLRYPPIRETIPCPH